MTEEKYDFKSLDDMVQTFFRIAKKNGFPLKKMRLVLTDSWGNLKKLKTNKEEWERMKEEIIEMNGRISMPVKTYHRHLKQAKEEEFKLKNELQVDVWDLLFGLEDKPMEYIKECLESVLQKLKTNKEEWERMEEEIIEMNGRISMPVKTYHKHLKQA